MRRSTAVTATAVALSALLPAVASCGSGSSGSSGSGASEGIDVVAAFYPYAYVAGRVAGEAATVHNLTPPGVEPHDLELTPQQVADLADADLVVYQAGFQPAIDLAVEQNPPGEALDVTDVVALRDTSTHDTDAGHTDTDHTDTDTDHTDTDTDHTDTESSVDPHLWLDPTLLIPITRRVADVLADLDPANAGDFAANADRLIADLSRLDAKFRSGLADCDRTEVVTSHAAFGYLTSRYALTMVPIAGLSPDADPSPQHLAELHSLISEHGITTVFAETLGTKAYADTLASDLGVEAAVLDPIEGLADEESGEDYLSLMRSNLAALRVANGCR